MKKATRRRKPKSAHLLGVGLDNEDGHKRLTRAEQFTIVGGDERGAPRGLHVKRRATDGPESAHR